jgi:EAL domain-containing protein (putative c-di-GMP-specific phosphodiesterase class I)
MQVIAAGVETDEQLLQLSEMGCDQAFGFCISAPVAPEEVMALLAASRQRLAMPIWCAVAPA